MRPRSGAKLVRSCSRCGASTAANRGKESESDDMISEDSLKSSDQLANEMPAHVLIPLAKSRSTCDGCGAASRAPVVILDADDVVLAEVVAGLHLAAQDPGL